MFFEKTLIPQKGCRIRRVSLPLEIIGVATIYIGLPILLFMHFWFWLYQEIYFSIFGIPKVRMRDYEILDRGKLKKLNLFQRFNCVYCGYGNALLAWTKAIANRTEAYSCAIKHNVFIPDHEHHKDFREFKEYK